MTFRWQQINCNICSISLVSASHFSRAWKNQPRKKTSECNYNLAASLSFSKYWPLKTSSYEGHLESTAHSSIQFYTMIGEKRWRHQCKRLWGAVLLFISKMWYHLAFDVISPWLLCDITLELSDITNWTNWYHLIIKVISHNCDNLVRSLRLWSDIIKCPKWYHKIVKVISLYSCSKWYHLACKVISPRL